MIVARFDEDKVKDEEGANKLLLVFVELFMWSFVFLSTLMKSGFSPWMR